MMKKFLKKSIASLTGKDIEKSEKLTKIDEEKLSERALHLLKKVHFQEKFVIMEANIFLRDAERAFNNGYDENHLQQISLRAFLHRLRKTHKMKDYIMGLNLSV